MYITGDVVANIESDMMRFMQPSNKLHMKFLKALLISVLQCDRVCHESVLKVIFIEALPGSICIASNHRGVP